MTLTGFAAPLLLRSSAVATRLRCCYAAPLLLRGSAVATRLRCWHAAPPPDVRRGYASPLVRFLQYGLRPRFGLCPL